MKIEVSKKDLYVSITVDQGEITGNLEAYDTGRCKEYSFEPSWFSSDEAEEFYNENYNEIEEQIQNKL